MSEDVKVATVGVQQETVVADLAAVLLIEFLRRLAPADEDAVLGRCGATLGDVEAEVR